MDKDKKFGLSVEKFRQNGSTVFFLIIICRKTFETRETINYRVFFFGLELELELEPNHIFSR